MAQSFDDIIKRKAYNAGKSAGQGESRATMQDMQNEIDRLRNELAIALLDAKTSYYRGMADAAQSFNIRQAELKVSREIRIREVRDSRMTDNTAAGIDRMIYEHKQRQQGIVDEVNAYVRKAEYFDLIASGKIKKIELIDDVNYGKAWAIEFESQGQDTRWMTYASLEPLEQMMKDLSETVFKKDAE